VKRAFKVATAFTGATAFATVMAPPTGAATPVPYTAMNCTGATANWVHLYYSPHQNHPTPACFGNYGTNYITHGQMFVRICTGNNYGSYVYYGVPVQFLSGSSYSFSSPRQITAVFISGHTTNYGLKCHV
jgi:hypothetical protein